jgi:hypothetical protein
MSLVNENIVEMRDLDKNGQLSSPTEIGHTLSGTN